jgi:hypothetical protein
MGAERLVEDLESVIGRQDIQKGDKLPMALDAAVTGHIITEVTTSPVLWSFYNLLSRSCIAFKTHLRSWSLRTADSKAPRLGTLEDSSCTALA